jgi:hypothetical protein
MGDISALSPRVELHAKGDTEDHFLLVWVHLCRDVKAVNFLFKEHLIGQFTRRIIAAQVRECE